MDQEQQQSQLKQLIAKGKEQGFLTYTEVNDHLPPGIVEPEQIEDIVHMINDMGITVHETTPAEIDQTLSDSTVSDDEAAEAAAAALASVDNEFGRTTDPVRMYMREMGTVELLTREGELRIAKRIEDGLNQVLSALSTYPCTIEKLLDIFTQVENGEVRLSDVISGFTDADNQVPASPTSARNGKTESSTDEDEKAAAVDLGPDLEEVAHRVRLLRDHYAVMRDCLERFGRDDERTRIAMQEVSGAFLHFKLVANVFQVLVEILRRTIGQIRTRERVIMGLAVEVAGMPRKTFIDTFPDNETDLDWIDRQLAGGGSYVERLAASAQNIHRAQRKLQDVEKENMLTIGEIKDVNRRMSIGEAKARCAKKEMVEANLRLVRDRAGDGLADPPGGIGGKLVAAPVLELVHGLHEADVALLDQIQKLQTAVGILLGDGDDQAQVCLDHLLLRAAGLGLPDGHPAVDIFDLTDGKHVLLLHVLQLTLGPVDILGTRRKSLDVGPTAGKLPVDPIQIGLVVRKGIDECFARHSGYFHRQAITRSIADQARTIRIPVHMIETINKLNRISRQMVQEMGREATPEELAARMEMPEDKVRKVLKIAKEPISMETPIGDDEDSHLGDFIEDAGVIAPVESATAEGLREATQNMLASLTSREAKVLRMRFGIDMNTDHTLEEVGKQFDVTRERIRQIEAKALRKLRHPTRSEKIKSFLDTE